MASVLISQGRLFQKCPFVALPKSTNPKCSRIYMAVRLPAIKETLGIIKPIGYPHNSLSKANYPLPEDKIEIFNSLEGWIRDNVLHHLEQVDRCWQPQDFLPDSTSDDFHDKIQEIKKRANELPDDFFVMLVGDMVTEEALPTYQTFLNTKDGIRDEIGFSPSPWAIWIRAWTAEENRHGDLLNKYLYLSGRVDMRQIEKTIQYLIGSGMDVHAENNPYLGFIYTSFQERATFISHGNTAKLAKYHGDNNLAKICGTIASDEKRHEVAYTKIMEKLFEIDPDGSMKAFSYMMRKKIVMPAHWMYDGQDDNLYKHFSAVSQRLGVYTVKDYASILEHLVKRWNVENLDGLSSEGRKAQDYVCGLGSRFRKLDERAQVKKRDEHAVPFSWIFNRLV